MILAYQAVNLTSDMSWLTIGMVPGLLFTTIFLVGIWLVNRLNIGEQIQYLLCAVILIGAFVASMYSFPDSFDGPQFQSEELRRRAFYVYFIAGPVCSFVLLVVQKRFRRL